MIFCGSKISFFCFCLAKADTLIPKSAIVQKNPKNTLAFRPTGCRVCRRLKDENSAANFENIKKSLTFLCFLI